jgi:hypothetical protein
VSSSSGRGISRRSTVSQAVASQAPEYLLEKGGPGATYANGAVAKVRAAEALRLRHAACSQHSQLQQRSCRVTMQRIRGLSLDKPDEHAELRWAER